MVCFVLFCFGCSICQQNAHHLFPLFSLKTQVLGLHQEWKGGDIARLPGGGQKIRLLKKYLKSVSTQSDLVVLFTDSYDVIMSAPGGPEEILARFRAFEPARVVFSSEKYCWPDPKLAVGVFSVSRMFY